MFHVKNAAAAGLYDVYENSRWRGTYTYDEARLFLQMEKKRLLKDGKNDQAFLIDHSLLMLERHRTEGGK